MTDFATFEIGGPKIGAELADVTWTEPILRSAVHAFDEDDDIPVKQSVTFRPDSTVGRVTDVEFDDEYGIVCTAEIEDPEIVGQLEEGLAEPAPVIETTLTSTGEPADPTIDHVGVYFNIEDDCYGIIDDSDDAPHRGTLDSYVRFEEDG